MNGEQFLNWCMTHYGEVITLVILIAVGTYFLLYKLATKPTHEQNTNFTSKGSQSSPIVQGNGTVGDIVTGNKETYSAPVVRDSTVGGDVVGGNKIVYQALPGSSILDEMEAKENALQAKGKLPEHELTWTPVRRGEVQLVAALTRELGCGIEQAYKSEPFTRQYCGTRHMVFVIKSSERGRVIKRDIYGEDDEISFSESGIWPYYRLELEGDRVIEKTPHEVVTDYKEVTIDMQLAQELFERVKAKTGIAPSLS